MQSSSKTTKADNGITNTPTRDDDDPVIENTLSSNNDSQQRQEVTEDSSIRAESQLCNQEPKKRKQSTLISCLERSSSFEEGGQKHNEITQALVYMICKDNIPLSCVEKNGLQKFVRTVSPLYKLPSRKKVTRLIENRYNTTKEVLIKALDEANYLSFTSDILTITNSTRSFLVLTAHLIDPIIGKSSPTIQSINLRAQKLSQSHTAEYIKETWDNICEEFVINKSKIVSITTDGGANMVAAVRLFIGNDRRVPCMAHCLNLIVDGVLRETHEFSALCDHVECIVTFFKQSVNASDQLRAEQQVSGKKEGEVLTLIQAVRTRLNSCLDMLERFVKLSALVGKILPTKSQTNRKTPDMVATSQLNVLRDLMPFLVRLKKRLKR
ncbi:zinc finger BED domain-containing protein 6-like [Microplitis mediator]|uniref:zinc finger BED domain-containing protein 6-like n=1 Tax=Microplitis mediator TaxID=375433 RepID=UPI00255427B9|nr:zinc finger BED domain-containing protein 6-like [Microplitis mediator]